MKISQKMFIFRQIFEVWCCQQSSNLTSVETFWCHEFSKNSGILQRMKKEAQLAIAREDWAIDALLNVHQINHHSCPVCRH